MKAARALVSTWLLPVFTMLVAMPFFASATGKLLLNPGRFDGQITLVSPIEVAVGTKISTDPAHLSSLAFDTNLKPFISTLAKGEMMVSYWIKASLTNSSSDTISPVIMPGVWDEAVLVLYDPESRAILHSAKFGLLTPDQFDGRFYLPAFQPSFPPGQTVELIMGVRNLRTGSNQLEFRLRTFEQAESYDLRSRNLTNQYRTFTLLFASILLFQVVLFLIYYLLYRKQEYLWYMAYLGMVVFYFFARFDRLYYFYVFPDSWYVLALYGYPIILLAYFAYIRFVRIFIRNTSLKPDLAVSFTVAEVLVLVGAVFFGVFAHPEMPLHQVHQFYRIFFAFMLLLSAYIFVRLVLMNTVYTRFILAGSGVLLVFLVIGVLSEVYPAIIPFDKFIWNQVGILLETFIFTSGLIFTGRWQEQKLAQSQQQLIKEMRHRTELEKNLEGLRQKVARDLHDDIGAMLSSISIYSQAAIERIHAGEPDKAAPILASMGNASREMVGHMRDMVWLIDPGNDSLPKLVERLEAQASELSGHTGIRLHFEADNIPGNATLGMAPRRDLVLIFREAMNNILRHAEATRCHISIGMEKGILHLEISDDGKGFDRSKLPRINGLNNIQVRAAEMGSTLTVHSSPGEGTTIRLELPIPEYEDFKTEIRDAS